MYKMIGFPASFFVCTNYHCLCFLLHLQGVIKIDKNKTVVRSELCNRRALLLFASSYFLPTSAFSKIKSANEECNLLRYLMFIIHIVLELPSLKRISCCKLIISCCISNVFVSWMWRMWRVCEDILVYVLLLNMFKEIHDRPNHQHDEHLCLQRWNSPWRWRISEVSWVSIDGWFRFSACRWFKK